MVGRGERRGAGRAGAFRANREALVVRVRSSTPPTGDGGERREERSGVQKGAERGKGNEGRGREKKGRRKEGTVEVLTSGLQYSKRDVRLTRALGKLGLGRAPVLTVLGRKRAVNRRLGKLRHRALKPLAVE